MAKMRAKMQVWGVTQHMKHAAEGETGELVGESLEFIPVARSDGYPEDGSDEDNSYAKWSPSGSLKLYVANPALFGQFVIGEKYYLDFTKAG